jgi:GH43 family beta-xylosidase
LAETPLLASLLLSAAAAQPSAVPSPSGSPATVRARETFTNPVAPSGADPWVVRWNGAYYYCRSFRGAVWVSRSERLQDVFRAPAVLVWRPPAGAPCARDIWAPELHHLDGRFYVYLSADDGRNERHRMYVLEGDAEDPLRPFALKGRLATEPDRWAIDGTVLETAAGRFLVWSGWEGTANVSQSLYVGRLANPWTLCGPRVRISTPQLAWERRGRPLVNEGPAVLRGRDGRVFVVYSASGSWTDDYCLGLLELRGQDPLEASAWCKSPDPVFSRSSRVFGPGHPSFVRSPDGSEDWIVYHAARRRGSGWDRDVRVQRFGWAADGRPDFGIPVPPGVPMQAPSGSPARRPR